MVQLKVDCTWHSSAPHRFAVSSWPKGEHTGPSKIIGFIAKLKELPFQSPRSMAGTN
ncbi:hypothetical protein ASPTUDRAFT_421525 [Aspergillus tubingensis CBS 134.48]|uniref:Uncharacterized protein n=1 Tax=Aspergillus tubingensis (strain CBS 134.48) TaxID=767770 RepID=A0A1L9NF40_ASPTC|nr:hypothetical protein ASPTUDRAFT_421525 [Aspergillus tubingensis CBS 134.48]